jgi:hypothetical protein
MADVVRRPARVAELHGRIVAAAREIVADRVGRDLVAIRIGRDVVVEAEVVADGVPDRAEPARLNAGDREVVADRRVLDRAEGRTAEEIRPVATGEADTGASREAGTLDAAAALTDNCRGHACPGHVA